MKRASGFSLVEVMISMAIGLIVIGGITAVFMSSSSIYRTSSNRARIQENSRFSLGTMQEDIRMAGYMGCFNLTMHPSRFKNLATTNGFESDYKTMVGGNEANGGSWTPALNAAIGAGGHAPLAGSDVLVVRIPAGPSIPLSDAMVTTSVPVPLASPSAMAGFTVGGLALISDCAYANVFAVTQLAATNMLVHANNMNIDAKLTRAFSNDQRATVTPIVTVSYFLANASNGVPGNHALFRQEGSAAAEEVADGVEKMQIEYGIDTDTPVRDALVNRFVTADQVGAFPVVAVKVSVLLRSSDDNVVRNPQKYNFDGVTGITPTDRRMYTPFTTTVALRNRGDQ
jgi:type IV pilus assembly protein PilW